MTRTVLLFRHTDNDGDQLTAEGVRAALELGRGLAGAYDLGVSTGAQRATQTIACFLAAGGILLTGGVVVEPGLRSGVEDRWRAAAKKAGGGGLSDLRRVEPELVAEDSAALGAGLRAVLARLPDQGSALAVGHTPTNEAAVFGLTGEDVPPLAKGGCVVVTETDGVVRAELR